MAIAKEIISRFAGEIIVRNCHPTGPEQIILFKNVGIQTADVRDVCAHRTVVRSAHLRA
jgi:hypothetical protein